MSDYNAFDGYNPGSSGRVIVPGSGSTWTNHLGHGDNRGLQQAFKDRSLHCGCRMAMALEGHGVTCTLSNVAMLSWVLSCAVTARPAVIDVAICTVAVPTCVQVVPLVEV